METNNEPKSKLKLIISVAKPFVIIGCIGFAVGLLLAIIGLATKLFALACVGFVVLFIGVFFFVGAYVRGKDLYLCICPGCGKLMNSSGDAVEYSFTLSQYEDKYDNSGKYQTTKFSYTCQITCPFCGTTRTFVHNISDKNKAKANAYMDKKMKEILSIGTKKDQFAPK